jgi:pimeloyl-ACP methyl ester carboxylesterase
MRQSQEKRRRYHEIMSAIESARGLEADRLASEWGDMFFDTDVYRPMIRDLEVIKVQLDVQEKVWSEFVELRDKAGYLEGEFTKIDIPVTVIHGDYDPHPIEGIRPFLQGCIAHIKFHILSRCGHYPWLEQYAGKRFFEILVEEINPASR